MIVSAMLEGESVQQAMQFILAELDAQFPRDEITDANKMAEYDPQTFADYKITEQFNLNQWISRELVIRVAIGRYYESRAGLDTRIEFAQSMYEALINCRWSSPYTRFCHDVAAEYDLKIMKLH